MMFFDDQRLPSIMAGFPAFLYILMNLSDVSYGGAFVGVTMFEEGVEAA